MDFETKVETYKQFFSGEISREEAEQRIGDDWDEVAEVASHELCLDDQDVEMDMKSVTENVSVAYDEQAAMWSSHYHGLDQPVASAGESKEEAIANLVDAVASLVE